MKNLVLQYLITGCLFLPLGVAQAALIVSNGGFEGIAITAEADGTNFTASSPADEWVSTPQGGNFPANDFDIANDGDDFARADGRFGKTLYQRVTGGGSGLYDLDFEYQKETSGYMRVAVWGFNTGGTFSLGRGGFDETLSYGDAVNLGGIEYTTDTTGWEADTLSIDLGGGYDSVIIGFATNINSNNGGYIGAVDNVSLSAIPEPSSIALLGLAGVVAILFRRRRG